MKALVYCYRSGWTNNLLGLARAGVVALPLTCPPLTAETFPYERLADADLIYIALHGSPGWRTLRGDNDIPALDVDRVLAGPQLRPGCKVVLEGCYGARTPFPAAFYARGAAVVVASDEKTWDRRRRLGRAGKAGSNIVRKLVAGNVDPVAIAEDEFYVV